MAFFDFLAKRKTAPVPPRAPLFGDSGSFSSALRNVGASSFSTARNQPVPFGTPALPEVKGQVPSIGPQFVPPPSPITTGAEAPAPPVVPPPIPPASNLTRVPTGSTGPDGKPIFDVFEGGRKIELPEFQKRGLNIEHISEGQAPTGFTSQFGAPAAAGAPPVAPEMPAGGPERPPIPDIPPEAESAVRKAESAIQKSLEISPEQLSTQKDLDKLIESTRKSFLGIEDQPIALPFITGQLASVERRALGLAEPLERKLARLEAARQSSLGASQFALERADIAAGIAREEAAPGEPFTLRPGEVRFGEEGEEVARGKEVAKDRKTQITRLGNRQVLVDTQTGETIKDLGPAPVSEADALKAIERSEKDVAKRTSQAQTIGIINRIISDEDFSKVVGSGLGKVFGGLAGFADIRGKIIQLKALTSLEGREKLKGSGTISDFEAQMLSDSATSINSSIQDNGEIKMRQSDAVQNLKNIRGTLQLKSGLDVEVTVTDPTSGDSQQGFLNSSQVNDLHLQGLLIDFL